MSIRKGAQSHYSLEGHRLRPRRDTGHSLGSGSEPKADETTLTPGRLSLGNVPAVCSLRCVPGAGGSCLRKARAGKPATAAVMTSWNWDVSRCPPREDGRAAASPCGREAPCGSKRTSARRASASRASCGADARSEGGEIDAGR